MKTTRHGMTRLRQRGFREGDVDLILETGTEITHDRIMLKRRDADEAIKKCKREIRAIPDNRADGAYFNADEAIQKCKRKIAALERLKGTIILIVDDCLVTAFHATGKKMLTGASIPPRRRIS